jgi:hypothetical protein
VASEDPRLRGWAGPLRRPLRHVAPLVVLDARRRLPPAQLCDCCHRQGRAEGAMHARDPLPPRGPHGMGCALQLRATVAQAGWQGPAHPWRHEILAAIFGVQKLLLV